MIYDHEARIALYAKKHKLMEYDARLAIKIGSNSATLFQLLVSLIGQEGEIIKKFDKITKFLLCGPTILYEHYFGHLSLKTLRRMFKKLESLKLVITIECSPYGKLYGINHKAYAEFMKNDDLR